MGNNHSNSAAIRSSSIENSHASQISVANRNKSQREHKRHGTVSVKISNVTANRRSPDNTLAHVITPRGAVLYGSLCSPIAMQKAGSNFSLLAPNEIPLNDSRAHKVLITHCNGWNVIPFPDVFSRHSGTCLILGDRNIISSPFAIKIGDCFRLGSVGLVVSELRERTGAEELRIDAKTLQFLKDEALAFDSFADMAALASDEFRASVEGQKNSKSLDIQRLDTNNSETCTACETDQIRLMSSNDGTGGIANGERFVCYMCYETHNTDDDALVAPCECKGDTRYLHVQCLQKWYHSSVLGTHAQVIRTTGNGAPACKICGTAYKTAFRRPDGKKASLLEMESYGPYLSLVVVTRHETNPGLFNTKFRLNFGRTPHNIHLSEEEANTIVIGRSSTCNMILDYRTVSTVHAKITYSDGKFFLTDRRSSNGTMIYLQDPLSIPYSTPFRLRMGRTTILIQARRNWTSAIRSYIAGNSYDPMSPTADDILRLLHESNQSTSTANNQLQHPNFLNKRSLTLQTIHDAGDDADGVQHNQIQAQSTGTIEHGDDYSLLGESENRNRFSLDAISALDTDDADRYGNDQMITQTRSARFSTGTHVSPSNSVANFNLMVQMLQTSSGSHDPTDPHRHHQHRYLNEQSLLLDEDSRHEESVALDNDMMHMSPSYSVLINNGFNQGLNPPMSISRANSNTSILSTNSKAYTHYCANSVGGESDLEYNPPSPFVRPNHSSSRHDENPDIPTIQVRHNEDPQQLMKRNASSEVFHSGELTRRVITEDEYEAEGYSATMLQKRSASIAQQHLMGTSSAWASPDAIKRDHSVDRKVRADNSLGQKEDNEVKMFSAILQLEADGEDLHHQSSTMIHRRSSKALDMLTNDISTSPIEAADGLDQGSIHGTSSSQVTNHTAMVTAKPSSTIIISDLTPSNDFLTLSTPNSAHNHGSGVITPSPQSSPHNDTDFNEASLSSKFNSSSSSKPTTDTELALTSMPVAGVFARERKQSIQVHSPSGSRPISKEGSRRSRPSSREDGTTTIVKDNDLT